MAVLLATSTPFALAQEEESSNDAAAEAEQQAAAAAAAEAAAAEAAARVGEYGSMKHFVSQSIIHTKYVSQMMLLPCLPPSNFYILL